MRIHRSMLDHLVQKKNLIFNHPKAFTGLYGHPINKKVMLMKDKQNFLHP